MANSADQQFLQLSDACMRRIQTSLDLFDPDEIEADLASGVLRISFADGRNCILNRQAAANQIWLAEGASAWHFVHAPESDEWLDTKGREELFGILAGILSRRLGRPVQL